MQAPPAPEVVPAPSRAEVSACAFPAWAPRFPSPLLPRHELLPLPPAFMARLRRGGAVFAPASALPARPRRDPYADTGFSDGDSSEDGGGGDSSGGDSSGGGPPAAFPELEAAVGAAVARLGGAALPKLSWSAPKDAVWLSHAGSLRCESGAEVLLLLLASSAAAHDACHAYDACSDAAPPGGGGGDHDPPLTLVLKRWAPPARASEFRCFAAAEGALVAVSQRHTADCWPHLAPGLPPAAAAALARFARDVMGPRWPFPRCVFDVSLAITSDDAGGAGGGATAAVRRLVDINPWGGATLPLLFAWSELEALAAAADGAASARAARAASRAAAAASASGDAAPPPPPPAPEVRVVSSPGQALRPGLRTGVPLELWDTSAEGAFAQLAAARRAQAEEAGA